MTPERWQKLSKEEQILNIASELSRTKFWLKEKNIEQAKNCLHRAFELIDLTINASRHQRDLNELSRFRDVLAQFYLNKDKYIEDFVKILKTLLMLNKFTSQIRI